MADQVVAPDEDAAVEENGDGQGEGAPRRQRGRGVIYWGLRDAEDAVRKIDQHAKRMSVEGFARALGHPAPKGRFVQKLDALKQFRLIELEGEELKLTPLATDMLYAGSEAARSKARATAFLNYDFFKRVFVECPKNQDHPTSYVTEFVKGKLGIINDADRFLRLFLDSAHFAGLLDGQPDPEGKCVRLRPAVLPEGEGVAPADGTTKPAAESGPYLPIPLDEAESILDSYGLAELRDRAELAQRTAGAVTVNMAAGRITIEVQRPIRIAVRTNDVLVDLPEIVRALRQKGFQV